MRRSCRFRGFHSLAFCLIVATGTWPMSVAHAALAPTQAAPAGIDTATAALDAIEAALGFTAVDDGTALLQFFRSPTAIDPALFAIASKPIPGDTDEARAQARDQRQRGTALWAIATALGAQVPPSATLGEAHRGRIVDDLDALPKHLRVPTAIALARIERRLAPPAGPDTASDAGGGANALLDGVIARSDLRPIDRVAARAMRALLAAETGASCEALDGLHRSLLRSSSLEQLLAADARAACLARSAAPANAAVAWADALALAGESARLELRAPLLERLGTLPPPESDSLDAAPALLVLAHAERLRERDPEALLRRLAIIADSPASDACRPLAQFELGRSYSVAQRYDEAIAPFRALATERPKDPLASAAIDLAMVIAIELHRAAPTIERTVDLRTTLDVAVRHFPDHPQRMLWRASEIELAAERGDLGAAMAAAAEYDPTDARAAEMRLLVLEAALDPRASVSDAERLAIVDRELERVRSAAFDPALAARRELADVRRALLVGDGARAARLGEALLLRSEAPIPLRAQAALALLDGQRLAGETPTLPAAAIAAMRRDPTVWWPALRVRFMGAVRALGAADPTAGSSDGAMLAALAPAMLEAATADGPFEARLELATALLRADAPSLVDACFRPGEETATAALLVRADARLARGTAPEREEARRLLRLVTLATREASPDWWRAELGQLRAAAAERTPESTTAVRARIHWLRGVDPTLGGEPTGPAIESLLRSLPDR